MDSHLPVKSGCSINGVVPNRILNGEHIFRFCESDPPSKFRILHSMHFDEVLRASNTFVNYRLAFNCQFVSCSRPLFGWILLTAIRLTWVTSPHQKFLLFADNPWMVRSRTATSKTRISIQLQTFHLLRSASLQAGNQLISQQCHRN